jgi:hypothetical protein
MISRHQLYYGSADEPQRQLQVNAGPLEAIFDSGDLRYLRVAGREVIRRIYVAVRDPNWRTIPGNLADLQVDASPDRFEISFRMEHVDRHIDFLWEGRLGGDDRGHIRFQMDGLARRTFHKARIGFCVLHPLRECEGQSCEVETVEEKIIQGCFPLHIAAHQPFTGIRSITHEVLPGLKAEIRFEGDIFEMEDQRNWSDGSYKIYSTPLSLPWPVELAKGTGVRQDVTLSLRGRLPCKTALVRAHVPVEVDVGSEACPMPQLGLGMAGHGQAMTELEVGRLKALCPDHLRVDLPLFWDGYGERYRQAGREARLLGAGLEIGLHVSDAFVRELTGLAGMIREQVEGEKEGREGTAIRRWFLFPAADTVSLEEVVPKARLILGALDSSVAIGAGSYDYFAQLNRKTPRHGLIDLACYSLNPQVHARDNLSLIDNLEAQASTVESGRALLGGLPLAITPITLRPRSKPGAPFSEFLADLGRLPPQVDCRQMSLFAAGWTVGSIKYLAEAGAESLTYFETTGWGGVMEREAGSSLPEQFPSVPGAVFPLYHVLSDFTALKGGYILSSKCSQPLRVSSLAFRSGCRTRLMLANHTGDELEVEVRGLSGGAKVRYLNETNVSTAMREPEIFRGRPLAAIFHKD